MFVMNTVSHDRRVLKEASSLRAVGYDVTIIGILLVRQPHPARETTEDGVEIVRVPISMAPEPWRPSPRFFTNLDARLRLRSQRLARRLRRRLRAAMRTVRRAARFVVRMVRATARRELTAAEHADLRRRVGTELLRLSAAAVRRFPASVAGAIVRVIRFVVALPLRLVFGAWAAIYVGVNTATAGQLDWLLNTRYRWTTYSRGAAAIAPPAAFYHGHDFSGIGAALRTRREHGPGKVIYDSHELYTEAGTIGKRSRALKWLLRNFEGRAFRESDALVTINQTVADELHARYGPKHTVLVHNCPPRWSPNGAWPDLIRAARDIPSEAPIALYQGAFTEVRGLRQMAASILDARLAHVHLALLGFGPMEAELETWEADPRYGGRLHVLRAVPPAVLDEWVASADVSLMPNQPETLNEIVSTPNKLFESIGAGVPVVTSDFPERRRIVLEDPLGPLGAVCDPVDPVSIADAILSVVGVAGAPPSGREAVRQRCLQAAHERWNWERESAALIELYEYLGQAAEGVAVAGGAAR
jgi:glycosyltransferase involved in cell wall biosynthesis